MKKRSSYNLCNGHLENSGDFNGCETMSYEEVKSLKVACIFHFSGVYER